MILQLWKKVGGLKPSVLHQVHRYRLLQVYHETSLAWFMILFEIDISQLHMLLNCDKYATFVIDLLLINRRNQKCNPKNQ